MFLYSSKGSFMVRLVWFGWFGWFGWVGLVGLVWFMVCSRLSRFAAWIGVAWFVYGSNRVGRGREGVMVFLPRPVFAPLYNV